jgi:TonB-linked SusC/RagA family outer membrane protein
MYFKHILKFTCLVVLLVFASINVQAQTRAVSGTIVDDSTKVPIAGVTIRVKNGPQTAVTNADGEFTLNIPTAGATLEYSHVGYENGSVTVSDREGPLRLLMNKLDMKMDEIVVVGYGTQRRSGVNTAISSIKGETIQDIPAPNIAGALRGRIAGLSVSQASGRPGAGITLNVRNSAISETASQLGISNEPLYVIDGITVDKDAFDNLDPSMVEDISILKDAASAAIYGAAGAKGVVLITTKRGKAGRLRTNYNGYLGTSDATRMPDMLSAYDLAVLLNDGYRIGNAPSNNFFSNADLEVLKNINYKSWFEEIWKPAYTQRHNLSFSGGSENVTFFAGGSYQNENGNYAGIKQDKFSFRAGFVANVAKGLKADVNFNVDQRIRKSENPVSENDQTFIQTMLQIPRWVPAQINGMYVNYNNMNTNPLGGVTSGYYSNSNWGGYRINTSLTYDFSGALKGLTARFQVSQSSSNTNSTQYRPAYKVYNFIRSGNNNALFTDQLLVGTNGLPYVEVFSGTNSQYVPSLSKDNSYQGFFTLQYNKQIKKHSLNILAGGEQSRSNGEALSVTWLNQVLLGLDDYWAFSTIDINPKREINEGVKKSFFGRFNYNYDGKYFLDGVTRLDASSNFATGNIWGVFPSVSAGWIVSKENFFKDNISAINYLKLRLSWGIVGDDRIEARLWQARYTVDNSGYMYGDNNLQRGINPSVIPNPDITWESKRTLNGGIELGLFKDKLNLGIDVFQNYSYNGFDKGVNQSFPMYAGFEAPVLNYMQRYNWGSEFNIGYKANLAKDLRMNLNMNFGFGNSIITQMYYNERQLFENSYPDWVIGLGTDPRHYSTGNIGLIALGMFRTQDEVDAFLKKYPSYTINNVVPQAGFLYYEDTNGDGKITERDQVPMFDRTDSRFATGIQLGLGYKSLSLSVNIAARFGGKAFYDSKARDEALVTKNAPAFWKDHWTPENPEGKFPRFDDPSVLAGWQSTFWAVDATTIRVNDMTLSYTLPQNLLKRIGMSSARILLTGNNLWVIKAPFKYMDPYSSNIYDYPTIRTISAGLSLSL